ncbi:type I-F CRISPR-associated protein Csy1 [Stagnimonas aquatica]|uniref:Type I-F CRISPR-associated protein Csy1 n=1 Tax=Stagnimonas aquatica TaxID=2689987 RepID=A0A3N0V4R8_9GAMM|nr:type I-F CRISPR-associated protein Csy1 [Stagnimonas aquatica]ROH87790.1 type I-F CRISPR-associated protein Csy1 [Stagnimonas aquatica]
MEVTNRSLKFRSAIKAFIDARRDDKLRGKEGGDNAAAKYEYGVWLADAARRVLQIQAVTHVLKATHPDARGSSLHAPPSALSVRTEIGTHSLGAEFVDDIVGNAAALDVFKFLKLEVDGRRLLDWMQDGDADLLAALHEDETVAVGWVNAFKGLVRSDVQASSHQAAKQLYWLVGDDPADDAHYQLLQPLFSSSLAHAVHARIQDARFSEASVAARKARREKQPHAKGYSDYRNLVARKLGGTKPQNISQLNSERGGVNYLLASLPPKWDRDNRPAVLGVESAMKRFARFEGVAELVDQLAKFLLSNPDRNAETRDKREAIEQALGLQLPIFAASVFAHMEPGWTRDERCMLPLCEQLWLDPERTQLAVREDHRQDDEDFKRAYTWADWPDEVAGRFANWLNEQLRSKGLPALGDAEFKHWGKQAIIEADWPVPIQRRAEVAS